MKATYESIMSAAMQLDPIDRCRVATGLWESVGGPAVELEGDALEDLLNQREKELEEDPSSELSEEAFMSHFKARRAS